MEEINKYPATILITNCNQCKHKKETNYYSTDGFDSMVDWVCEISDDRKIQGAVEWHEEKKIEVPNWCPLRVDRNIE